VLRNYLKAIYLFTYSDLRTTLIPVTAANNEGKRVGVGASEGASTGRCEV